MTVVVATFIRDLLFGSQIDGFLSASGFTAAKIRSLADAEKIVASTPLRAAILNLQIPGDEVFTVATLLLSRNIEVFSYFPHVETQLRDKALACGLTEIHPRGAILDVLHRKLGAASTGALS